MYFEDLKLGMAAQLGHAKVEKEPMMAFAEKYDNIPIHTSEEYASNTHYGEVIASGLYSFIIMWAKYVEKDFIGDELLGGKSSKIEWLAPVFAGDELHGDVKISALTERNEKNGVVEMTINVYNQSDVLVLTDVTEAVVKKRLKPR